MPAWYPVHVIDEHIWEKTDPHPDKRERKKAPVSALPKINREETKGAKIFPVLLRVLRFFVVDFRRFPTSLIATRTTPQKHRDRGRKSPEPKHPPITIRPGNPERR